MKKISCFLSILCIFTLKAEVITTSKTPYRYVTSEQKHRFRIPLNPKENEQNTPVEWGFFGVTLNGAPIETDHANEWKRYQPMSDNANSLRKLTQTDEKMLLVGYAADGFPIYSEYGYRDSDYQMSPLNKMEPSYRLKQGNRKFGPEGKYDGSFVQDYEYVEGLGDLDACNGRFGVTPQYPNGVYHYFLTDGFPHVPRFFKGTPDSTFLHRNWRR